MAKEHPLFLKYRREWLAVQTGYSRGYLSRVARGKAPLSRNFIDRVCFKLGEPEEKLFDLDEAGGGGSGDER